MTLNFSKFDKYFGIETASAHCDIPCGIYDPSTAIIAALSVVRLMDVMIEKSGNGQPSLALQNTIARCVYTKEKEAEKVKHEIRIIWGDFIKSAHLEKFPDAHSVVHQIMMKASACKQEVHREDGLALVDLVNQFAEMFWACKNVPTERKVSPYAPNLEVVRPA